jgi:hypothetical protein
VRPHHDITHPESDPAETIHFLRNSNIGLGAGRDLRRTRRRQARHRRPRLGLAQLCLAVVTALVYL